MATGPDHYREAERLTARAINQTTTGYMVGTERDLAAAQVHATLALAAATAEPIAQSYDGPDDTTIPAAWSEAIS